MNISRVLIAVAVCFLLMFAAGCGSKDQAKLEAVKRFDNLPESTQQALLAEDMAGVRVYAPAGDPLVGMVLNVFLENGATRSNKEEAEITVASTTPDVVGMRAVVVKDKNGNGWSEVDAAGGMTIAFARRIAENIGIERKTALLHR